jgi:hypothetical protein
MKNTFKFSVFVILIFFLILQIQTYRGLQALEQKCHKLEREKDSIISLKNETTFIWNGDEEEIPTQGSLLYIELIKPEGIYITSVQDENGLTQKLPVLTDKSANNSNNIELDSY